MHVRHLEKKARLLAAVAFALAAAALSGCARTEGQSSGDYLDPDLRAKVKELERDLAAGPTTPENAPRHSATLWKWANAYALAGGVIPIDLPSSIRQVTLFDTGGKPVPEGLRRRLDLFTRELQWKDEHPDGLGTLRFAEHPPIEAGGFVTVEEIYTVGTQRLEPGTTLLVGRQMMPDQGEMQSEDPAADHYVSIKSSNPSARWAKANVQFTGMHSARSSGQPNVAFRLEQGTVEPGETVTFTIGDKSGGSRGFRVQTFATDLLLLPIYVDFAGDGLYLSQRWPGLDVLGQRETVAARAYVPSIVAPGERFTLSVRSEDSWSNRVAGPAPAYDVLLDGKPWKKLAAGGKAVQFIDDARLDTPGIHRFTVKSSDGKVAATSNPVWVRENPARRVYWGETHGHCGFGEGQGSPRHFFEFGHDDSRLDFLTITEHDALTDDGEWRELDGLVRKWSEDGKFVTFLGYEWSAQRPQGGHHNVIFRRPGHRRIPLQEYPILPALYRGLRAENDLKDVLIIPHAHNAGDWTRNDPDLEKLVEVSSLHGTFEWFGNLYLKSGFTVGFVGGSDDHRTNPGMALSLPRPFMTQREGIGAVWAPAKTTDAIFDGLKNLSAYASTGERIILDASLNGQPMGTRQPDAPRRRIEAKVAGTSPIDHIDLVKNGKVAFSKSYLTAELRPHSTLQLGFESSSEVFFPDRDNPRPQRVWKGTFEVVGARLLGVAAPGLDNIYSEYARRDEKNPNQVAFLTQTRGRMDTLLLELDGAGPQTAIRFHLEPTMETGSKAGNVRPNEEMPAVDFELRLDGLDAGRAEHAFQVGKHTDRIALQVIDRSAPLDQSFEYTDMSAVAPGDYYYVRVTQLDGNQAFSSPFWVGDSGRPPATPSPETDLLQDLEGKIAD